MRIGPSKNTETEGMHSCKDKAILTKNNSLEEGESQLVPIFVI